MACRLPGLALAGLCACGGEPSAPPSTVTVSGIIDGAPFVAVGVLGVIDPTDPNVPPAVHIADRAITCSDLAHFLRGRFIDIEAFDSEGCPGAACTSTPAPAGTYSILKQANGRQAIVDFSSFDAQCAAQRDISADVGGTVVLTKAGRNLGEQLQGSFDVIIGGNRITGTFQTTICPAAVTPDHVCR